MKKGFTLIELISVIVILGAIALIAIPVVEKSIKSGKQRLYEDQINMIKLATNNWLSENNIANRIYEGNTVKLSLYQLKLDSLLDNDIKNPLTEETFPNDIIIEVTRTNGALNIEVLTDTGTTNNDGSMPYAYYLSQSLYTEVKLSNAASYKVPNSSVYDRDGYENITVTTKSEIPSTPEANKIYQIYYEFNYEGGRYLVIRNVKFVDDTPLALEVPSTTLKIKPSEYASYDFAKDATITGGLNPVLDIQKPKFTKNGTYTVKYTVTDDEGNIITKTRTLMITNCDELIGKVYNFDYEGAVQTMIAECPGTYKLEVWGAQGGNYNSTNGGKGGYSSGTLELEQDNKLYIHVGGTGSTSTSSVKIEGGYNGGGSAYGQGTSYVASSGGGATDIRIGNDSLYSRVIVAGGGGGAGYYNSVYSIGGAGGGATGVSGTVAGYANYGPGTGGTQVAGGTKGNKSSYSRDGSFGFGAEQTGATGGWNGCGGGGGWYGGGSGGALGDGGGGGSGWIYTASTFSTWQLGNATDAAKWELNNSYYLDDASTAAGSTSFTDPNGSTVTGHSGNGYARITYLGNCDLLVGKAYAFEFTGDVQTMKTTCPGRYKLEVWGASGGGGAAYYTYQTTPSAGGKGGYSIGTINLEKDDNIVIYVGGQGGSIGNIKSTSTSKAAGGFNGGGSSETMGMNGGGGATDIRINQDSLYSRVIVAGGGGGGGNSNTATLLSNGGAGGGVPGETPTNQHGSRVPGKGGLTTGIQTSGSSSISAGFGIGAGGTGDNLRGGGGGGWYGGTMGANSTGGGGGSGWIYTAATFATWQSGNATDAARWELNSNYYLTDASTTAGNASFTDPNGSTVTGHSGNGHARITYLGI